MVGRLQRVSLRDVWKHEALDFSKWLESNLDVLNEITGLDLSDAEREKACGAFAVDLLAEDGSGNPAVIENQLGKSDHDHLGKLITYLTMLDAKVAVWIVSEPRPEHVQSVVWLNESTAASFYLVKLEAVVIGESEPAPLLTLVVGPSDESKKTGETKKELAGRYLQRHAFWESLLKLSNAKLKLFSAVSPGHDTWISAGAGRGGMSFNYAMTQHGTRVELYIDGGKDSEGWNRAQFQGLANHKTEIEAAFGESLVWDIVEGRRGCRISSNSALGGYSDEEKWPVTQEHMVNAMVRLEKALRPYLKA
jgi:hypothetical protein